MAQAAPEPSTARIIAATLATLAVALAVWWYVAWRSAPPPPPRVELPTLSAAMKPGGAA